MKKITHIALTLFSALLLWQCTKLENEPLSTLEPSNFNQNQAQVTATVHGVYAAILEPYDHRKLWFLQEVPTEMGITPKRGSGWSGDGEQRYKRRTWDANEVILTAFWRSSGLAIGRANAALEVIPTGAGFEKNIAEVKFFRAWLYYGLLDVFGYVPIVEVSVEDPNNLAPNHPIESQQAKLFEFIERDLLAAIDGLETTNDYPFPTVYSAQAALAKLYLNAEVFTGTARWADCIAMCDEVIASPHDLEPSISDSFGPDNFNSNEILFASAKDIAGTNRADGNITNQVSLRDVQSELFGGVKSGWGGNSMGKEHYDMYEDNDYRKSLLLFGELRNAAGDLVDTVFEIDALELGDGPLDNQKGLKSIKYTPDPSKTGAFGGNDVVLLRYADILMAKAECLVRLNGAGAGDALINQVRSRNFSPYTPVVGADLDFILDERAREFSYENLRRQDLIRFGEFINLDYKFKEVTNPAHNLYPIPQVELDRNSALMQNPDY